MKRFLFYSLMATALTASGQTAGKTILPFLKKDGHYSFVDSATGRPLAGLESRVFILPQENGLLKVQQAMRFGCVDRSGKMVVPNRFDVLHDFSEDRALAMVDGRYFFVDPKGREISARYDWAQDFRNGLALVSRKDKYGFINRQGREVVPLVYDLPHPEEGQDQIEEESLGGGFSEGLAIAWKGKKVGFVDDAGKLAIPARFTYAEPFHEGLALVQLNGRIGFVDKTGRQTIPPRFDGAGRFSEGLAWTYDEERPDSLTFIDRSGRRVFSGPFRRAEHFSGGLAAVQIDQQWGYVDRKGIMVIPARFFGAESFHQGHAVVQENGKYGLIDTRGAWVLRPVYDNLYFIARGIYGAEKEEQEFCVSTDGKEWKE